MEKDKMKRIWKMLRGNRRSRKQRPVQGKPVFENLEPRLLLNAVPYIQDFSLGKPDAAAGWDYYSDNEGRIEVVSGRLQMDDTAGNSIYSSNEAILHVDLTGKTGVTLTLDHWSLSDENDALPASFAGRFKGDGIALSVDGLNWVKVTDLTIDFTNQSFKLDSALEQAKIAANSTDVSDVQIKFQQYDNYPSSLDGRQFDNIKIQSTTVVAQAVPYLQDFTLGKPDASEGWEYNSDSEGRIQVVSGRLRLDDIAGNGTYSSNEAILHVNLANTTGVTLTLDHLSLADENDALPASFFGQYKGDGIALSVDGQNWVRVTNLSVNFTNQTFDLDTIIQQAKIAANSTDLSNVRIKFQQYDNYSATTDGREFDNIKVKATSIAPEMDVLGNGIIIVDGDTTPNSTDHTNFGSVFQGSSIVRTFTIMNTGAAALNITGVQWTGSADYSVVQQPASVVTANGGTTTFKIQFAPTKSGLHTATIQIANNDANENPYDFVIQGTGLVIPTEPEIDVLGNGIIIVDGDTTPNSNDHTNFGSVNQGSSTVRTFTIMNTGTATLNITSVQRIGSTNFSVVQQPASVVAANGGTTTFQIQFAPSSSGLHIATIQIANDDANENPYDFVIQGTGLAIPTVSQAIPYIQTFTLGKPGGSEGWEYYSDNEGRIQVVNGRLRMDDTVSNSIYSLNEAILHVNLTGKTGVTLTLDHWNLADEVDTIIPNNFIGHYKGDGIALSVDGQNWVKVSNLSINFTNQTFSLDTLLQQAKIAAGSTDVSNVRIKFQQYDNQSASTDGREFDNIVVNFGVNQAPVISSVTASPSAISDTETSQLKVIATDPDNSPNPLTYSWTVPSGQGSLNNLNIANPIYTPPNVSTTQTFILTVKVSDGTDITSKTVNITVTDTIPVNQAPVISSVTASPSTISDAETSQLQVIASDPDSGPNPSLTYSWTVASGQGTLDNNNIANPTYTPPDVTATETFTLTAHVFDGAAITSKTVDIMVTDTVPGPQILLSDDFTDGNYNGWTLVDQGTMGGPMAWSAASKVMVQSSNVHTPTFDGVARLGTYAYWQDGSGWTDYTAAVTMKSNDNDIIGLMFRYQDENNYYRFTWDKERNTRNLVKNENGQFTILAQDSVPYVTGKNYQVKIAAQGSSLQVSIDGSPVFSVNDSTFSSGTIALYSWGNTGSYFDDILVDGSSGGVNQAPVISSVTASPSTISDTETSQLQVTATDPDNGPNPSLTYSWSVPSGQGSLDNLNIANPTYTPPDVSATQTFTLTVKVSDGAAITSKTVNITVTDTLPGPQILLSEDFNDGNYNGWSLVDQGTQGGPMAWSVASGVMVQSSNVHTPTFDGVARLGTYAHWQAGSGWTDYTAAVTMKSNDNDIIGIMFRYQDENNYYRFTWDKERSTRNLVKCENGLFTILAQDSVPYVTGKSYQVKIAAQGSLLQVSIDGSPVFSVNDSTFSSGSIALYSWGNTGSYFDDIMVTT
jgi:hypothetical protein